MDFEFSPLEPSLQVVLQLNQRLSGPDITSFTDRESVSEPIAANSVEMDEVLFLVQDQSVVSFCQLGQIIHIRYVNNLRGDWKTPVASVHQQRAVFDLE